MQNPLASGFRRCFCTSRPHDMFCFGHASARITFDVLQSAAPCGLLFVWGMRFQPKIFSFLASTETPSLSLPFLFHLIGIDQ